MPKTTTVYWESVLEELERLPESGPVTREDVIVWARWHMMLVNCFEEVGWVYRGESFKDQGWATLLVVKGAHEGTPLVAFVTERTPTDCMKVFLRQMDEGRVEWREDKFARN